jgi:hypothetical protein
MSDNEFNNETHPDAVNWQASKVMADLHSWMTRSLEHAAKTLHLTQEQYDHLEEGLKILICEGALENIYADAAKHADDADKDLFKY